MHILTPIYASILVVSLIRSTCVTPASLSQVHIDARRSIGEAAAGLAPSHRLLLLLPPPLERVTRSVRCSGRVGRYDPCTPPCEGRPRARSLAALSAAQRSCLPQLPRPRLPWPQTRPPSPSAESLAHRSARPCDRARSTGRMGCGAWRSRLLMAAGALCARAETARVVGRWVDVTRAVYSRVAVLCELM
jgi:hypothetical protein